MEKKLELKAENKEIALTRAKKILALGENETLKITEIEKASSFLGMFKKDGTYLIEVVDKILEKVENNKECEIVEKKVEAIDYDFYKNEIVEKARTLIKKMDLDLEADVLRFEERHCIINITGEDKGIIIGKQAKTLNSFELLLNNMVRNVKVSVDVEEFKEKKDEKLRALGKKVAENVIRNSMVEKLYPMTARERKIIHEVINQYPELVTYSEGEEPKRYIKIKLRK